MKSWSTESEFYGEVFYYSEYKRKKIVKVPDITKGPCASMDCYWRLIWLLWWKGSQVSGVSTFSHVLTMVSSKGCSYRGKR